MEFIIILSFDFLHLLENQEGVYSVNPILQLSKQSDS